MSFAEREYQSEAENRIFREFDTVRSTLLDLPTGMGKTVIIARVIKRFFPRRCMVIAHRQELIWQAKERIETITGLRTEIEMGEYKSTESKGLFGRAHVVISTVQTHVAGGDGGGRMSKFDPMDYSLLIIDEAHHATSPSYKRIIDYYRTNPKLKVLGVTATPDRADEEALGQVFDSVAYDYEILDGIHDGWLVPVDQQMVNINGLEFSTIRTTAGDLNGADLESVMTAEKPLHGVAAASIEIIGNARSIVFASSVMHARMLCEIFNRNRPGMSAWVSGKTDKEDRKALLAKFKSYDIQVICNCGVLTEGFDDPGVECIVMARPTKSRALYAQMLGRSTRPLPGVVDNLNSKEERRAAIAASVKPKCLILDFVGNSGRHKLISSADILGGKMSEEAVESAVVKAKASGKAVRMDELLESEEEERRTEAERKRLAEEARRANITAKAQYSRETVSPFDILQIKPVIARGWDTGKQLTDKQKEFLRKRHINPDKIAFSQAKQLIGEILDRYDKGMASFPQAKILRKYNYPTNIPFEEARVLIDAIASNGWRRPAPPVDPRFDEPMNAETNKKWEPASVDETDDVPF